MQIAWMDSVHMVAIEQRRNTFRLVVGVVLLLYAFSSLASGVLSGFIASLTGNAGMQGNFLSLASTVGLAISAVAGLLGLVTFLTARRRAMVVSSSGSELVFGCMAVGPWHLAQVDGARLSLPDTSTSNDRIVPPTTPDLE